MTGKRPPDLTPIISLRQPASRVWPMSSWLRGKVGGKAREPSLATLLIERLADIRALLLQGDSRRAIGCDCLVIAPDPTLALLAGAKALETATTVLMAIEPDADSWWLPVLDDPRSGYLLARRHGLQADMETTPRHLLAQLAADVAQPSLASRMAFLDAPKRLFPADAHAAREAMIYLREIPGCDKLSLPVAIPALPAPITDKRRTVIFARSILLAGASMGFPPAPPSTPGDTALHFPAPIPACPVTSIGPAGLAQGSPTAILSALDAFWPSGNNHQQSQTHEAKADPS